MKAFSMWRSVMLGFLLVGSAAAQAAVSCNVTAQNVGELYPSSGFNSVSGDLRISCTRTLVSDPAIVYYSIKADFGVNSTGGVVRKVRDPVSNATLSWVLHQGTAGQGSATNWGTTAVLTGNLSFAATALATSTTLSNAYTMSIQRGGSSGNPVAPTAGTYVDTVTLTPDMSTTGVNGPFNVTAPTTQVSFTVGVIPVCVVRKQGQNLTFNYSSFTPTVLTQTSNFEAICSNNLPYEVTVSPAAGTIAGINYTVSRVGVIGRTANGNGQAVDVKVDIAANQSGTCNTAVCSGSATHTVTIKY